MVIKVKVFILTLISNTSKRKTWKVVSFINPPIKGVDEYSLLWLSGDGTIVAHNNTYYSVLIGGATLIKNRDAFDDKTRFSTLAVQKYLNRFDIGKIPVMEEKVNNVYSKTESDERFSPTDHTHKGLISFDDDSIDVLKLVDTISESSKGDDISSPFECGRSFGKLY